MSWIILSIQYLNRGDISLQPGRETDKAIGLWVNKALQTAVFLILYLFLYETSPVAYCEFCQNLKGDTSFIRRAKGTF